MRRTMVLPVIVATAALATTAAAAPAATHRAGKCRAASPQYTMGSLEWQRAWSDAWSVAHPGQILPGPQVPGSIGEQRAWAQAWQQANPGKPVPVVLPSVPVRAQRQC